MKKFIMYGAGNIGRGFIGKLFSDGGYKVGFVDINKEVINRLNSDGEYPVNIVSCDGMEEVAVKNVYGIDGSDVDGVAEEIASADMMATAIGVNVLKFIAKPLAAGLKKRFDRGAKPFDIIICENMIGADAFLKGLVKEQIPEYSDKIDKEVGFVEASIGRMVPVVTEEKKRGNPLRVYVEPYGFLPVDEEAFRGEIPKVDNLYPFKPFNLFIERKLFMHNMSHATVAYLGYLKNFEYIYEAIADSDIKYSATKALIQSAFAVSKENGYPVDGLIRHAENLIYRFSNKALGDTVARVGRDTKRKLGTGDRLIGAIKLCDKHNLSCEYLCLGVAAGLFFAPDGDDSSKELKAFAKENGAAEALKKYCGYEGRMAPFIVKLYDAISQGKQISALIAVCDKAAGNVSAV